MNTEEPTVPCKICGKPTHMLGTKLCDPCWEVESRLDRFLETPGGRAYVKKALYESERVFKSTTQEAS